MKILFVSDLDFTLLYKETAYFLKEKLNCKIDILIGGRLYYEKYKNEKCFDNSYLFQDIYAENESLKYISWQKTLKDIDIYEKKYGRPTLLSAALSDRFFSKLPREERAKRVILTYKKLETFLKLNKPDFVISSGFEALPHFAFSDICQYKKIPIFYILHTRILNYHSSMYTQYEDSLNHGIDINLKPKKESLELSRKYVEAFSLKQHAPILEAMLPYDNFSIKFVKIKNLIRYFYRYYISKTYANDHAYNPPHKKLFFEIQNRFRRFSHKYFNYDDVPKDIENWYYFPLHIQPEYTTLIAATNAQDQIGTIISLSNSLSLGEGIIVKEHPGMLGRRTLDYYKSIKNLPNVRLVKTSISTFELINKTKGTITINGSAGMEAILLGKPVMTIGNCPYNRYYNVLKLKDIPRRLWAEQIKIYINNFTFNKDNLISYVAKVFDQSNSFNFLEPNNSKSMFEEDNLNKINNHILDEIKKFQQDNSYGTTVIENRSYI